MRCLGLDIGSSTIKGAVLDLDASDVGSITREPFPEPIPGLAPGRFEIDPEQVHLACSRVLSSLRLAAPDARALLCSGQMGGLILVDDRGQPRSNYLSWRDERTLAPEADGTSCLSDIRSKLGSQHLQELGHELQPGSTSSLLYWLSKRGELPKGAIPCSVADYVVARLLGAPPRMHRTHAIGLLDLRTGDWHRDAFERLNLDSVPWPELTGLDSPLEGPSLPCFPAVGDQQCALHGAGVQPGDLSVNVSTGSQVSRRTSSFEPGPYQSRAFIDDGYLNTITHLPAGRSLNVLMDLLCEITRATGPNPETAWSYIATASDLSDADGLECDLSFFPGPLGDRGSLRGITTRNLTAGNLFYAAFRSMAENYAHFAGIVDPARSCRRVVLSGGLATSMPALSRLIRDRFDIPVVESSDTEETFTGLLHIARRAFLADDSPPGVPRHG